MRATTVFTALLLFAAAAPVASAQGLATANLPGMQGGVGIDPHGTGFAGTLGDPAYYSGSSEAPESEGHYSPYGTMTMSGPRPGTRAVPGGIPYEVAPPAMQYRFNPSSGR
jgi:hypothetical protein